MACRSRRILPGASLRSTSIARTEDPEARPFTTDIRVEVAARRTEFLAALLTIWRWGRIATEIEAGLAMGSFEQWTRWVRDPLVALGCQDPAERVSEAKERDRRRQAVTEMFAIWWKMHLDRPIAISQLHDDIERKRPTPRAWPPVPGVFARKAHRHAHGGFRAHAPGTRRKVGRDHLCAQENRRGRGP